MKITRLTMFLLLASLLAAAGCGGPTEQTPEQFQSGLEEAAKAAERGKELQKGVGGVPPVPDPENEG